MAPALDIATVRRVIDNDRWNKQDVNEAPPLAC